jgi:type II secretory pathway pseudopilin PulG
MIELLLVILVLGVLAATVIFALTSVTSSAASAACKSDAKTTEEAVQAYIASPDNTTRTPPSTMSQLYAAPFNSTGNPLVSGTGDIFMTKQRNNAFSVYLGGDTPAGVAFWQGGAATATPTSDGVFVQKAGTLKAFLYDDPAAGGTDECDNVT